MGRHWSARNASSCREPAETKILKSNWNQEQSGGQSSPGSWNQFLNLPIKNRIWTTELWERLGKHSHSSTGPERRPRLWESHWKIKMKLQNWSLKLKLPERMLLESCAEKQASVHEPARRRSTLENVKNLKSKTWKKQDLGVKKWISCPVIGAWQPPLSKTTQCVCASVYSVGLCDAAAAPSLLLLLLYITALQSAATLSR